MILPQPASGFRCLAIVLSAALALLVSLPSHAGREEQESSLRTLGKIAADARLCGLNDVVAELRARFGVYRDFMDASNRPDSSGDYGGAPLGCSEFETSVRELLQEIHVQQASAFGHDPAVKTELSTADKRAAADWVYSEIMASISEASGGNGRLQGNSEQGQSIGEYRNREVHGHSHKSLVACLYWDLKAKKMSHLAWNAARGSGWVFVKRRALSQCRKDQVKRGLQCECTLIDHDNENVVRLPYIVAVDYKLRSAETAVDSSITRPSSK